MNCDVRECDLRIGNGVGNMQEEKRMPKYNVTMFKN
jgi:hypothetical protein